MQAPETQSTSIGVLPSDSRLGRFRRVIGFFGKNLVRKDVRPKKAVRKEGNDLAEFCSLPSFSRTLGPTIPV
jgi:hypothetical protein